MAQFRIKKPYSMEPEEVRQAAEQLAHSLEEEHGVRSRWEGDTVVVKGAGVEGNMSFHDGVIDVRVKLGMVASMFAPVLKEEINRFLDEHVT